MDLIELIRESKKGVRARGSAEGRSKMSKGGDKTKASKSRVKVYASITTALKKGTDDEQEVGGRTAKGFSPGSIPSKFKDVKKYAVRTLVRHGKQGSSKFKSDKYWSRKQK